MSEDNKELLPLSTTPENILDLVADISSIVPWFGAPLISNVVAGISQNRKFKRVRDVLLDLSEQIKGIESEVTQSYVKTDDFNELLEKALRQAADERSEEKLKAYANFLAGDIKSPGLPYDEKISILHHIEQLQADNIRVLKAFMLEPNYNNDHLIGSISQTLQKRLPDISMERIIDLVVQLKDIKIVSINEINTMMTARGAEELKGFITPYGQRFIFYIFGHG